MFSRQTFGSKLLALAGCFTLSLLSEAKTITDFSIDTTEMAASIQCSVSDGDGTNVLYYAWSNDGVDKGDDISSWPNVRRVCLLENNASEVIFTLPQDATVTAQYAARVFVFETAYDFDYAIEGTKSTGTAASSATCYIDTEFYPIGNKSVIVVDCLMNHTKGQQILFGCNDASSLSYCGYINGTASSGGKWAFSCNNGTGAWKMPTTLAVSTSERVVVTLDGTATPKGTVYVKSTGTTYSKTYSKTHNNTAALSLTLWCRHNATDVYAGQALATIYSCTITEEGVLKRDFRPAMKSGVAGLWDAVENKFYSSAGSAELQAVGANLSNSILDGDSFVSASPSWVQTSSEYITDNPFVESLSLEFAEGGSKSGPAPLVLTGKNNWGGEFINNEGALIADFGQGLATTDALYLNGGTYGILTGDIFNWQTSGGVGKVNIAEGATSYGFSTYTHPFSVVVNGDAEVPLEFGTASLTGFNPSEFVLNDDWATDTLTFKNAIIGRNTNGSISEFAFYTGSATAIVERSVSNVGLVKKGEGTLLLNSSNSVNKIRVENGIVLLTTPENSPVVMTNIVSGSMAVKTTGAKLHLVNSMLDCSGTLYLYGDGNATKPEVIVDNAEMNLTTLNIGAHSKSVGNLIVTNNSLVRVGATTISRGSLNQHGGEVSLFSLKMGTGYTYATGYNVFGGKTICRMTGDGGFYLGVGTDNSAPSATMDIYEGAEVEVHTSNPSLGRYAGDTSSNCNRGYLNVKGGSFSVVREGLSRAEFFVGYSGSGGLLVTNGTFSIDGGVTALHEGYDGRSAYVRIMKDGVVKTDYLRKNPREEDVRSSSLTINGGKIIAQNNNDDFISNFLTASVGAHGAVIDTALFEVGISQSFASLDGEEYESPFGIDNLIAENSFAVTGGGTLSLTGTNTWACATSISNSVLKVGEKSLPETNLRLDNGVIDLGGYTHTITNLIGTGIVSNGTLIVVGSTYPGYVDGGTLVVAENASIVTTNLIYRLDGETKNCGCLDVRSAFNLSEVVVSVEDEENLGNRGVVLVKAAPLSGFPQTAEGENIPLRVADNKLRMSLPGMVIFVR